MEEMQIFDSGSFFEKCKNLWFCQDIASENGTGVDNLAAGGSTSTATDADASTAPSSTVFATYVTLTRNLKEFKFPDFMAEEDAQRVKNLICDAFEKFDTEKQFLQINFSELNEKGIKYFKDMMFLTNTNENPTSSKVFFLDAKTEGVCITVNDCDHYRILVCKRGLSVLQAYQQAIEIDTKIQKYVKTSVSQLFGYLNSSLEDCGFGLNVKLLLHSPFLTDGMIDKSVRGKFFNALKIESYYKNVPLAIGKLCLVSLKNPASLETDFHTSAIKFYGEKISEIEENYRQFLFLTHPTIQKHDSYKALSVLKGSLLLNEIDACSTILSIKNGLESGLFGFEEKKIPKIKKSDGKNLNILPLLYYIKDSFINSKIETDKLQLSEFGEELSDFGKACRLRSLILQDFFSDIEVL